jgi:Protein of unknown function (DUF1329)
MNSIKSITSMLAMAALAVPVAYAVSAEEAAQLGGSVLTVIGAERAGNKEGTIPEYTGKGVKPPPTWDSKNPGQRPDPYGEKPLFSITAANAAQYAGKLDGMIEVFKRYPDYRMDVYPSHRDYVVPQYVVDNTKKNVTECRAENNEMTLKGCYGGVPFPIPKNGKQVMWNHLVSYNTFNLTGVAESWLIPTSGAPVLVSRGEYYNNYPVFDPDHKGPVTSDVIYLQFLGKEEAPVRIAGQQTMIIDPVDQLNLGRRAYVYVTGRRWVKLAADLSYDTPNPYSGGSATMDDMRVFYGALDRWDFELAGKKEKFIQYDNYMTTDMNACAEGKLESTKGYPHPDCVRWELHRVWVVKATLKPGFHHIYSKRMMYWDEDGFIAGNGENYNNAGKLIRVVNNFYYPMYDGDGAFGGTNTFMNLETGVWSIAGDTNCHGCGYRAPKERFPKHLFDPNAMGGVR